MTYSQILRTVGSFADRETLEELRVFETQDGVILQGRRMKGDNQGEIETFEIPVEDLQGMLRDAVALRRVKAPAS